MKEVHLGRFEGNEEFKVFEEFLHNNTDMKKLHLGGNKLSEKGAESILINWKLFLNLEQLSFTEQRLNEKCIQNIGAQLKSIKYLD